MRIHILRLFISLSFILFHSITFSQFDTSLFIRSIILKHTSFDNLSIEFIKNGGIQHPDEWMKKKVWIVKAKESIQKMRVETTYTNPDQKNTICIINGKQAFFINSTIKRSDVFSFNLLKDDKLEEFNMKQEIENLPSFMINEGNLDLLMKEQYEYIKNSGNISLSLLRDTNINGTSCFGVKIIDNDKNNGYLTDKTGNSEEKYADKTIEYTYYRKSDSLIVLKITDFLYVNPNQILSQIEQVNMYLMNNKQNENSLLYTIRTDTLKDYFQTLTRFNGADYETALADFSVKKAPGFSANSIQGKFLDLKTLHAKKILLLFFSDDDECINQLTELNEQYEELKRLGLEIIAINSFEILTKELQQHLLKKGFLFPVIFSKSIGDKYLCFGAPAYFLLDEDLKIKDVFYQINQEKIEKILKMLK